MSKKLNVANLIIKLYFNFKINVINMFISYHPYTVLFFLTSTVAKFCWHDADNTLNQSISMSVVSQSVYLCLSVYTHTHTHTHTHTQICMIYKEPKNMEPDSNGHSMYTRY